MRSHPTAADSIAAAILLAVAIACIWVGNIAKYRDPDVWAVLLTIATVGPVAWRRRWPGLVLVFSATAIVIYHIADYPTGIIVAAILLAIYTCARHRRRRTDLWPAAVWVGELGLLGLVAPDRNNPGNLAGILGISTVAWLVGDAVRSRSLERVRLVERAERAEREREANACQAVADERARIARELHDVVAHALGVIIMQAAGAGRKRDFDMDRARTALANIEATGRQAFGEMRRLVGVLRDEDDDPELAPQPTIDDISSLVRRLSEAGHAITLTITGNSDELPSGAGLSAYRIVQEALTNSLKHATGAAAHVTLAWSPVGLEIDVTNDAPVDGSRVNGEEAEGGGHGLIGMRERALLFGGRFTAGSRPEGGFRVHASVPAVRRS
jgi:signal transduction histidine kinase